MMTDVTFPLGETIESAARRLVENHPASSTFNGIKLTSVYRQWGSGYDSCRPADDIVRRFTTEKLIKIFTARGW